MGEDGQVCGGEDDSKGLFAETYGWELIFRKFPVVNQNDGEAVQRVSVVSIRCLIHTKISHQPCQAPFGRHVPVRNWCRPGSTERTKASTRFASFFVLILELGFCSKSSSCLVFVGPAPTI